MIDAVFAWEYIPFRYCFGRRGLKDRDLAKIHPPKTGFDVLVSCLNEFFSRPIRSLRMPALGGAVAEHVRVPAYKFRRLVKMFNSAVNSGTIRASPEEASAASA